MWVFSLGGFCGVVCVSFGGGVGFGVSGLGFDWLWLLVIRLFVLTGLWLLFGFVVACVVLFCGSCLCVFVVGWVVWMVVCFEFVLGWGWCVGL